MKFEKFVKSLGVHGVIHERKNGERWINGLTAIMKIPDIVTGVMAKAITEMPEALEDYVNYEQAGIPCYLAKAIMPSGDSGIKDCVRIFKSEDGRFECGIRNIDFALIEKSDQVEMYIGTNTDTFEEEVKALLIKRFTTDIKDPDLVGLVMPYHFEQ
ncbi:MAG: hypothetical protein ABFC28_01435 [Rikenellaceae bacterium]